MKRPNKTDFGHGDHALMWYSDKQDKYIDYLESKLKSDLLNRVSESFDKDELREAYNAGENNINCYGDRVEESNKDFEDCIKYIYEDRN